MSAREFMADRLPLGAQSMTAINIVLNQDDVIAFRAHAEIAQERQPDVKITYNDIKVVVDGRGRAFTLGDFLRRLGFIEPATATEVTGGD